MRNFGAVGLIVFLLITPIAFFDSGEMACASGEYENSLLQLPPGPSYQFDPDIIFQRGVTFNAFSNITRCDPGTGDFEIGYLNQDSLRDLAVISNETDYVTIFNGTADGGFSSTGWRIQSSAMRDLRNLAVGDLDGDGLHDIVVSHLSATYTPQITILYQSNNFDPSPTKSTTKDLYGSDPRELVIGDFGGTPHNDVAVACSGATLSSDDRVTVWRYPFGGLDDSTNIFVSGVTNGRLLAKGDVDGDGKLDLIVGDKGGPSVVVMPYPFSSSLPITIAGHVISDIATADIAGNGRVDLAIAVSSQSRVYVFHNTGSGLPPTADEWIDTHSGLSTITLGDLNGDSVTDLVTLSSTGNNASVFLQALSHEWYPEPNQTFPINAGAVKAMISNFTSMLSLFVLANGGGDVPATLEEFYSSSGKVGNADFNLIVPFVEPYGLASGSFETDRRSMASTSPSTNEILIFELGSDRKNRLTTRDGPSAVAFGSFDATSGDDIVVANKMNDSVSIYLGSGGIFTQRYPFTNVTLPLFYPSSVSTGMILQTSSDDVVVGCEGGVVVLYNNETSPYFDASRIEVLQTGLLDIVVDVLIGDFNNDGIDGDIAALTEGASSVQLFFRFSTGTVGNYYSTFPSVNLSAPPGSILSSMAVGDFNIDGRMDICVANDTAKLHVFQQPPQGFYDGQTRSYDVSLSRTGSLIRSGDMNDDGVPDLVVLSKELPVIGVLLNRGNGMFTGNMNFTTGSGPNSVIADDIDGDGRTDLASTAGESSCISLWFQNNLRPMANATASKYVEREGAAIIFSGSGSDDSYSDRSTLQYYWSFGDASNATGISVSHTYLEDGDYSVRLAVTDRGGLTGYSNITVIVTDEAPVVSFSHSPLTPVEGSPVSFTDTTTSYPDELVNWTWEFGDGDGSYLRNPSHVYLADGAYDVRLSVADDDGSIGSYVKTLYVLDGSPVANFTISPQDPLENASVYYNSTSLSYPDDIVSLSWTFGDGESATGERVIHRYLQNGTYTVTLTVTDSDGSIDRHSVIIQVRDSIPTPSFSYAPPNPLEGEVVQFFDESSAYDGISSWIWDFGDGSPLSTDRNASHQYENNGSYEVRLTISDSDGSVSNSTRIMSVADTTPYVFLIATPDGVLSFDEDEMITFTAKATPGWEVIVKYEWDFSYSGTFVAERTTVLNRTSYSYGQQGSYTLAVRVWDSDSYSQTTLLIEIVNVRPIANFTYVTRGTIVTFDASTSSDTPSDQSDLEYRWNFGDGTGWSPWYENPVVEHTFVNISKQYAIVLNVRDNDGSIATMTKPVVVDTTKPSVFLLNAGVTAFVARPTTIVVNVTDDFGVGEVLLHYRIGNVNYSETMTMSSPGVYEGQIPSQNRSMTVVFWVEATDTSGNKFITGEYEIFLQTVVPIEYWVAGIGILAFGLGGLVMGVRRRYASVDEVFVVYEDGRLIAHETRRLKPGMDDEVLSSMLVAIQSFVKDSFKDENVTTLKRLDFGEKKILIEKGDRVYLAGVLHGRHAGKVPQKMFRVLEDIERDFGPAFTEWDGDFEKVRGVKDRTQPLFKRQWPMPIRIVTLKKLRPKRSSITTVECPMCDSLVPADSKVCPSCGVDLAHADVDDLERVAKDMMDARHDLASDGEGADDEGGRKGGD